MYRHMSKLTQIANNLGPLDLINRCQKDESLRPLCRNENFWRDRVKEDYPGVGQKGVEMSFFEWYSYLTRPLFTSGTIPVIDYMNKRVNLAEIYIEYASGYIYQEYFNGNLDDYEDILLKALAVKYKDFYAFLEEALWAIMEKVVEPDIIKTENEFILTKNKNINFPILNTYIARTYDDMEITVGFEKYPSGKALELLNEIVVGEVEITVNRNGEIPDKIIYYSGEGYGWQILDLNIDF